MFETTTKTGTQQASSEPHELSAEDLEKVSGGEDRGTWTFHLSSGYTGATGQTITG